MRRGFCFVLLGILIFSCNEKNNFKKNQNLKFKEEVILNLKKQLEGTDFSSLEKEITITYMRETLRFLDVYKDKKKSIELAYEKYKYHECKSSIFYQPLKKYEEKYLTEKRKIWKLNKNFNKKENRIKISKIRKKNKELFDTYHDLEARGRKASEIMTAILITNKNVVRQYDKYLSNLSGHSFPALERTKNVKEACRLIYLEELK